MRGDGSDVAPESRFAICYPGRAVQVFWDGDPGPIHRGLHREEEKTCSPTARKWAEKHTPVKLRSRLQRFSFKNY